MILVPRFDNGCGWRSSCNVMKLASKIMNLLRKSARKSTSEKVSLSCQVNFLEFLSFVICHFLFGGLAEECGVPSATFWPR